MLNNTVRNSTRFQLLILRIFNICFLKVNLRIIFLFKRCFFSHFLPLVAASGINNTQICNVQAELGTCLSQENLILTEHSTNKYLEQLSEFTNNRKLPSPYACFWLATYIRLNLLKGTMALLFTGLSCEHAAKLQFHIHNRKQRNKQRI